MRKSLKSAFGAVFLYCVMTCTWPSESHAVLIPGVVLGGQALLDREAGAQPGARGALTQIEIGYLWEWPRKKVAFGIFLPLETDFGSRFAVGPRVMLELMGSFRFFTGAMLEFGTPFSNFFIRNGVSIGWRNTGKRPQDEHPNVQAGVYLWLAVDYRIANPNQAIPQHLRIAWGLRFEFGALAGNTD